MKITVDAVPVLAGEGGISNYVNPLVQQLCCQQPADWQTIFHWRVRAPEKFRQAQGLIKSGLPEYPGVQHSVSRYPDRLYEKIWRLPLGRLTDWTLPASDVYLATTPLIPCAGKAKRVSIVHDIMQAMIPEYFPEPRDAFLKKAQAYCDASDRIICVSQNTATDLQNVLGIDANKITVIYPGLPSVPDAQPEEQEWLEKAGIKHPFILYMGSLSGNKNTPGLLKSFGAFHKRHPDWQLVLTGKNYLGESELNQLVAETGCADAVRVLGWISDEMRWALLRNAALLMTLSWYEGFGLPVLEAMSVGLPALVSNRGSLPEVIGNSDQTVDPEALEDVVARMCDFADSALIREEWGRHMVSRAADFSWRQSGAKLVELLARIVG